MEPFAALYVGMSPALSATTAGYGSAASLKDMLTKFGYAPEKVMEAALTQIEQNKAS
jgi:transketolase